MISLRFQKIQFLMDAVLSYLDYISIYEPEVSGVEFFQKSDRLNCRISNKAGVTLFLNSLNDLSSKAKKYMESVINTSQFIEKVEVLLDSTSLLDDFNRLLNVKSIQAFTRTLQEIYTLWLSFNNVDLKTVIGCREELKTDFQLLLRTLKNVNEDKINSEYLSRFEE